MTPINKEHLEALELDTQKLKNEIIQSLPELQQKKIQVIEDCVAKLKAANIPFWMSTSISNNHNDPDSDDDFWSFNNLMDFYCFDDQEKVTENSILKHSHFKTGFLYTMVAFLCEGINDLEDDSEKSATSLALISLFASIIKEELNL